MGTKGGESLLYERKSYLFRGACFDLYKNFGGAFKERVVHNALIIELEHRGLKVDTEKRIPVVYKGQKVGTYAPDLIINDVIVVELKVKPFLTGEDERQFWYYLRSSQYKLGFLINFGPSRLQVKRRIYDKARKQYPH